MAYTSTKTWQFNVNQVFTVAASASIQNQILTCAIKNSLTGFALNPWTTYYSCNAGVASGVNYGAAGVAGDGVDRWVIANQTLTASGGIITVPNDVNYASAGTRHSWTVLQNLNLGSGTPQICIDCGSAGTSTINIIVSPSAGFTGGTATARPTATDEYVLYSGAYSTGTTAQHVMHAWESTDGQCSRIMIWSGGTTNSLFLQLDRAQNPISGWTNPWFASCTGTASGIASGFTVIGATASPSVRAYGIGGTPIWSASSAGFTYESYLGASSLVTATGIGTAASSFNGEWPELPMGVAVNSTGNTGRVCNVFDQWWKPTAVPNGDTYPNNANTRNYAALGGLVLPWVGGTTVPLTS